ncbi:hypothetical protein AZI87_14905 [Bdellovibrio bacteriovorus]|uniref:Uncharacterized protein n=1 Tax=Bdellovibrio bacteriovorus TaxID=959 RepID=A0A162FVX2_BDEBC|nr:hypothetical protein [Bdellovibrio bacteriovorus]KYG62588.1 hypothetical protein AZI87_14905 [Bdellovibrio bacteriovorus]
MKRTLALNLILASSLAVSACSFQKNPNKLPPATPEPVKIGMTKEEVREQVIKMEGASFPDKLLGAIKLKDEDLLFKLVRDVDQNEVNQYAVTGETALEIAITHGWEEVIIALLSKGSSPYKPHKKGSYTPIQMLQVPGRSFNEATGIITANEVKYFEQAKSSMNLGPAYLINFYSETRFPLLKVLSDGSRTIDFIYESGTDIAKNGINLSSRCDLYVDFFEALERLEGPLNLDPERLLKLATDTKSAKLLAYILSKKSLSSVEILEKVKRDSVDWKVQVAEVLSLTREEKESVQEEMIKVIETITPQVLQNDLSKCESVVSLKANFPQAFERLVNKLGADVIDAKVIDCLPRGKQQGWQKLYEDILEGNLVGYCE